MKYFLKRKIFSWLAIFSLLLQISNGFLFYLPVFAEDNISTPTPTVIVESSPTPTPEASLIPDQTPSPTPTPEVTPTPNATNTPEPTIEPSPSLEPTPTLTPTPEPTIISTPEASPQVAGEQTQTTPASTSTPSPSATSEPEKENGHLSAIILKDIKADSVSKLDLNFQTEGSALIQTDKLDYAPTDTVLITGTGFLAEKTYTIIISSSDDPAVTHEDKVTADAQGNLVYSYQLDGYYRPNYKVEIKDGSVVVASTTFTDTSAPSKPDSTSTTSLSTSSIKFQWKDKSNDEDEFHVERATSSSGPWTGIATVATTTKVGTGTFYNYTDTSRACNTAYYYRVRAHRHSDDVYSSYSNNNGDSQTTLYWTTDSVTDLTPDSAVTGSTNVPILSFTMTSCDATAQVKKVKVEYTGTTKNDLSLMKLYEESGTVAGFDPGTDTLLDSVSPPGGSSTEFTLDPSSDVTVGAASATFYVVVDLSSTPGNTVDAKISPDKIDIGPNNPSGATENDWPLTAETGTWDPAGSTTITAPDTTAPTLSQVTPVPSPTNDNTPDYTFNSSEAGTISYGGDCSSGTTAASTGDNTITFNTLSDGSHNNCTITVTDEAGNPSSPLAVSSFTVDTVAPISTIDSPTENSFWNSAITIYGSSTDIPNTSVSYVKLYYRTSGIEENPWTEIPDSQQDNEDEDDPFEWSFNWIPPEDGQFDIKAEATDDADNTENSPVVEYVTYDTTVPIDPTVNSTSHTVESWLNDKTIDLSWPAVNTEGGASDNLSGVDGYSYEWSTSSDTEPDADKDIEEDITNLTSPELTDGDSHYFHLRTVDNTGNWTSTVHVGPFYIDTTAPETPVATPGAGDYSSDQSVTLASSDFGSDLAAIYYTTDGSTPDITKTLYTGPITVDRDMTIKAISYDNAGNASSILSAAYGIPPKISAEASSSVTSTSTTITWTTDDLSTSRVVYDTVSHEPKEAAPNYGYGNSTVEDSTKVTAHSVGLTGLTAGTTYYYRTISHGSPEAVSSEKTFGTSSGTSGGGGTVAGASSSSSTSPASAPVCNDTKPGSAPVLTSAVAGVNSVTLTWTKATDPVSYYLVTYGTTSGAQTYGNPNVGDSNTTSYTINGLSGGTTYYFKVRAGNGCMPGDYSNEFSATPTGVFVTGPAAGFAQGVLGEKTPGELGGTEATATATQAAGQTGTGEVAGAQAVKTASANWWWLILPGIGLMLFFFYLWKKPKSS